MKNEHICYNFLRKLNGLKTTLPQLRWRINRRDHYEKERTKRICNYFMKGLLLCALVFGFWFMADAGVNADEVGIPKNFTPGTIEMVPFTKGENSNPYINITNNSDKPVKVTFEHNIEQTDHNYKLSIYVGNHECVSRQNPVAKDANVLYLYPYQRIEGL